MRRTSNPPSPRRRPSSVTGIFASATGATAPSMLASHMGSTLPGRAACTVKGLVRLLEPAHNVELRSDHHGHAHVVFSFPYRADIVDAVRAIPGRRFDWDAKEWWAPQADDTAPFVKGVIERHPSLRVADDVRAWLSEAVAGWVGRVTATRLEGRGAFALETISGDVPEELVAE